MQDIRSSVAPFCELHHSNACQTPMNSHIKRLSDDCGSHRSAQRRIPHSGKSAITNNPMCQHPYKRCERMLVLVLSASCARSVGKTGGRDNPCHITTPKHHHTRRRHHHSTHRQQRDEPMAMDGRASRPIHHSSRTRIRPISSHPISRMDSHQLTTTRDRWRPRRVVMPSPA